MPTFIHRVFPLLVLLLFSACSATGKEPVLTDDSPSRAVPVRVLVTDIRNDTGEIMLSVFTESQGFPCGSQYASYLTKKAARQGRMEFELQLESGRQYALAILHDENANQQLELEMMLIPKEGFAVSNNSTGLASQSFNRAIFSLDGPRTVEMKMQYYQIGRAHV